MITRLLTLAAAVCVACAPAAAFAQDQAPSPAPSGVAEITKDTPLTVDPDVTHDLENILYLDLSNGRRVAIRLVPQWAPKHVERIKTLTRQGFYDGLKFHRVIDGFMAQTGDPTGTGTGGSPLPNLEPEFNQFPHVRGTLSMARAQAENSANSQFFIVFYPRFSLDRRYTNLGRVISGMDAVDMIERGEPPQHPTTIVQASIAADHKPQKLPAPEAPALAATPIAADQLSNSKSQ